MTTTRIHGLPCPSPPARSRPGGAAGRGSLPCHLSPFRGREAAQLQQAAAGKGLTGGDRAGAGASLPLSSAAEGESEGSRRLSGHGGFQKHGKQRILPGSVPCQATLPAGVGTRGSDPSLCPDSRGSQARAAAAGLCLLFELLGVSGAQHSLAGVSIPELPVRGVSYLSGGVPRLPAADSDKTRLERRHDSKLLTRVIPPAGAT